jgi:putative ABC transport system permease protein
MIRALDRKLLRDLWRIKGQAVAIAAVIGSGVAMFVMYRSTFDSLGQTLASYYDRHRFAHVFASAKRVPEGLAPRIARIPGVAQAETRVVAEVTLDVPGMDEPAAGRLVSIPADRRPALNDLFLRQGRWIAPGRSDEVLISEVFAERHHLEPGAGLDAVINGRRRHLRIVGVALSPEYIYSIRPGDLMPDPERFGILWMERRALAAAFDLEGSFNDVVVRLAPGASEGEVLLRLDRLLAPYGSLGGIGRAQQSSHWYVSNELTQLMNVGSFLPTLFLAVAAFLLNVVLTRIVSVQREQIAALKANGYSNLDLGLHFGKLGGIIALGGAAVGTLAGAWMGSGVTKLYVDMFRFPVLDYNLAPYRIGQAVLVGLAAAVFGALGAVRRVAALPPAEAMRPEPPAAYSRTLLERIGLGRFLSAPSRMILRNLSRKPLRTAVGVFGIAIGGALIILGGAMRDGVWALMDEQFALLQRQDATVSFTEPASARAFHELTRLPGVVYAEPMRTVPVRLRHGHLWRRTAIQGLIGAPRLDRLVDTTTLQPILLPEEGLVLSTALADLLEVGPGDVVTVEILEGARPVRQVRVARLVDQHMGTAAYLRIDAVQRLVGSDRAISGAALQVEPSQSEALYRRLKEMPRVAAVSRKAAFIESFRTNFAKNLDIVVTFTTFFATIIAIGVVYNNARISLAERARELASLRVLGFRRSEISYIFLGELAAVTLLALPFVFLLGYGLVVFSMQSFNTELYRFPIALTRQSFARAGLTVVLASLVSGLVVRRQLDRLDLIAVLKTRE